MPRPTRKANPPAAKSKPQPDDDDNIQTVRKGGKRRADDTPEEGSAIPTKSARTALGKSKQQPPVVNGLNNNGPEQPKIVEKSTAKPSTSKAKQQKTATVSTSSSLSVTSATLYCFGQNDCGQLGLPEDVEKRKFPSLVTSLQNKKIIDVACGGMHTLALDDTGVVWSFGLNDDKALGRQTKEEEDGFEPGVVDLPKDVKAVQISAGDSHSAALSKDGQVFIWGCFKDSNGNFGLIADDGEMCREKPQNITADLNVKITKIASGAHHIAMLGSDGQLYTCGTGDQGQLGRERPPAPRVTRSMKPELHISKKEFLLKPAAVKFGRVNLKINDIWAGEFSIYCSAGSTNDIYVFGLNNYSQLGIPQKGEKKVMITLPTKNTTFKDKDKQWKQIAAGQHHTVVLDHEGKVYTLGRSNDGRLGIGRVESVGEDNDMVDKPTLVPMLKDKRCVRVAAGGSTSYAVTEEGHLYSWGFGTNWQLATGDDEDRLVPARSCGTRDTPIEGKVVRITAGGQHVALTILKPEVN